MPAPSPMAAAQLLLLTIAFAAMPAAADSATDPASRPADAPVTDAQPDAAVTEEGRSVAGLLVSRWSLAGDGSGLPVWMDHSSDKRFHDPDLSRAMRMDALRCAAEGSVHGQGRLMHSGNLLRVGF